jgi:hypothetical protein
MESSSGMAGLPHELVENIISIRTSQDDVLARETTSQVFRPHKKTDIFLVNLKDFPCTAMQVCTQWRNIIVNSSQFYIITLLLQNTPWDNMSKKEMNAAMCRLQQLLSRFARSDIFLYLELDIDIRLIPPSPAFLTLVSEILSNYSRRFKMIQAKTHSVLRTFLMETLSSARRFPILHTLRLPEIAISTSKMNPLLIDAPMLRNLLMDGSVNMTLQELITESWRAHSSNPPQHWEEFASGLVKYTRALTHGEKSSGLLQLEERYACMRSLSSHLTTLTMNGIFRRIMTFLELSPLPLLENLTIQSQSTCTGYPESPVCFPSLKRLTLIDVDGYSALIILESIAMPKLASLFVTNDKSGQGTGHGAVADWTLDKVRMPELTSLYLNGSYILELTVLANIDVPKLERLELWGVDHPSHAQASPSPRLARGIVSLPKVTQFACKSYPKPLIYGHLYMPSLTTISTSRLDPSLPMLSTDATVASTFHSTRCLNIFPSLNGDDPNLHLSTLFPMLTTMSVSMEQLPEEWGSQLVWNLHGVLTAPYAKPFPRLAELRLEHCAQEWGPVVNSIVASRAAVGYPLLVTGSFCPQRKAAAAAEGVCK